MTIKTLLIHFESITLTFTLLGFDWIVDKYSQVMVERGHNLGEKWDVIKILTKSRENLKKHGFLFMSPNI